MKYNIKVIYDSGDTENRWPNQTGEIPLEVEDIKLARKALLAIKEHKELWDKLGYCYDTVKIQKTKEIIKQKEWCDDLYSNGDPNCYIIKFDVGNGKYYQIHTFWYGVFEHINRAEIVVAKGEVIETEINSIDF